MANPYLMELQRVSKTFQSKYGRAVKALDGVSLQIRRGETLGVVGESGCGKSTLARVILSLHRTDEGSIHFEGEDITKLTGKRLRRHRRSVQMVFQDPGDSLDPRMTALRSVMEPLVGSARLSRTEARAKAIEALTAVGLGEKAVDDYPHSFSGGERQRIGIARAVSTQPELIVLDEPTSALDVSIQAQILNLLLELQRTHDLTYVFISHDMGVVRHMADRMAVMYAGQVVEIGQASDVFNNPSHPYTLALLSSVPQAGVVHKNMIPVAEPLSPASTAIGCPFVSRCWLATERCQTERPALIAHQDDALDHQSACHHVDDLVAFSSKAEK